MSVEDNASRPKDYKDYIEDLVGSFGKPDSTEKIEALTGMDPLSLGILTRSIRFSDPQRPYFGSRKGRRRFGPSI